MRADDLLLPDPADLNHHHQVDDIMSTDVLKPDTYSDPSDNDVQMESPVAGDDPHGFPVCQHDDAVIGRHEFIWRITDWPALNTAANNRVYSDSFFVPITAVASNNNDDGWWFKALLMPKGQDKSDTAISLYLAIDEQRNGAKVSGDQWSLCADFVFALINPDSGKTLSKYVHHRFDSDAIDWGFSQFVQKSSSDNEEQSIQDFVSADGQLIVKATVRLIDDPTGMLWIHPGSFAYDSKRATGCVGLQNQGATCYMNSILQSLFLTNAFRKSIYHIPTDGKDPHDSIPLALQRLFYALTFSAQPPNTNDLTASFGWDLHESFTQHDVQEFLRVLMDDLEEKMKGTAADGHIDKLFGGRVKKVIRCLNIEFESSRTETVYDVQLPVAGCPTLKDSFEAYIARETMTGENRYMAEGHGLQDAEMFNVFDRLPPVLHLILMRYRYDPYRDATVKINDRFEFPEEVDLSPYMSVEMANANEHYLLHSVLVHSGDGHGGHYTAFIRPDPLNKPQFWLKFDDTRVTVVSRQEAMDDNFGGHQQAQQQSDADGVDDGPMTRSRIKLGSREAKLAYYKRVTNAYMLVYIRKSEASTILCPFTLADIPSHITRQLEEEHRREEERRQERLLEQTTVKLAVYTPGTVAAHPGYDLFCSEPHPVCPITPCHRFRLKKDLKVSEVIEHLKHVDPQFKNGGRLWSLAHRRNRTLRFDAVIYDSTMADSEDGLLSLDFLSAKLPSSLASGEKLQLFAEPIIDTLETGCATNQKTTINIFFKLFDPEHNQLRPLNGLLLDKTTSMLDNEAVIRRLTGIPTTTDLTYYEEVKVGRVDLLAHPNRPLADCELQSGDIIIVVPRVDNAKHSLNDYYDHIQSIVQVSFRQHQTTSASTAKKVDDFEAVISAKASLEDLVKLIGERVQWPFDKIRPMTDSELSSFSNRTQQKQLPDDFTTSWLLFVNGTQTVSPSMAVSVYYELLPVTVSEWKSKRMLKVKDRDGVECQLWVDKQATVGDIDLSCTDLCKNQEAGTVHFYELSGSRIVKEVPLEKCISDLLLDELMVERFAEVDAAREIMIPGYLHNRDITWGCPFMFKLIVAEPLADTKKRVAARLGITGERDLAKLAVHLSRYGKAQRTEMSDTDSLLPEMRPIVPHEQLAVELAERFKAPLESAIKIKRTAPTAD